MQFIDFELKKIKNEKMFNTPIDDIDYLAAP